MPIIIGNISRHVFDLAKSITTFLDYLILEKGLSKNTIESYNADLQEFNDFAKKKKTQKIEDINKKIVLSYYELLDKKQLSKATLQRRYSALNQFFKFLIKREIITENPMLSMRRQKKEVRIPKFSTQEEISILLETNSLNGNSREIRNRLILEMLYSTGMRVSELCNLPIKSVIFNDKNFTDEYRFLTIKGKGQKERIVPLRASVLPILNDYIKTTKKEGQKYLFSSYGKQQHIDRRTIENVIKQTAIACGINPDKVSPHVMRHSFATHLLQKGLDIREIQELLGHSSIDTTAIYAKINTNERREVLEKYHPLGEKHREDFES